MSHRERYYQAKIAILSALIRPVDWVASYSEHISTQLWGERAWARQQFYSARFRRRHNR